MFDEETGDYYLRSRYYKPETSRFTIVDDPLYGEPFCLPTYAYCLNSPVLFSDKDGHYQEADWLAEYICDCLHSPYEKPIEGTHYCVSPIFVDDWMVGVVVGRFTSTKHQWHFRKYPTDQNAVDVKLLEPGTSMYVKTNGDSEWLEALLIHDNGYVSKGYVHAEGIHIVLGYQSKVVIGDGYLNVRRTPSKANGKRLFTLEPGTWVYELFRNKDDTWSYISSPKGSGWVMSEFLESF